MAVIGAILALGLLIIVHEAGHYFVARWCRMRVDRFSIGFGPALLRWRKREPVDSARETGAEAVVEKLIHYARREPNSFVGVLAASGDDAIKKAKDRLEYHARDILVRIGDDRVKARADLVFEVETYFARHGISDQGDDSVVTVAAWEQTDFTLAPVPFGGFVQINGMLIQDEVDMADERASYRRSRHRTAGVSAEILLAMQRGDLLPHPPATG